MTKGGRDATVAKQAARTTALVAALIAATNVIALLVDPHDSSDPTVFAVDVTHAAIATLIALWFSRARARSVLAAELGFAVAVLPFLLGLWLPVIDDFASGQLAEPLMGHHFLLLGIAICAPTMRSGIAFLALFVGHALVLVHVLSAGGDVSTLAREPWMTCLFAAIATMLLYTRARRRRLEQRVASAEERTRMLVDVARMLVALRDRANSPLQTMAIAVELLAEDGVSSDQIRVLQRSLHRLTRIQETLAWSGTQLATIAGDVAVTPDDLEQSLRELLRQN